MSLTQMGQTKKSKRLSNFIQMEMLMCVYPRPIGGTIEYTADGKVLAGESCTLPAGTKITMKFKNWNGWIKNIADGEYSVTDRKMANVLHLKA